MDVKYENRIRIQDLELVSAISEAELSADKYYVETSIPDSNKSAKYSIRNVLSNRDKNPSTSAFYSSLAHAAQKRYWTQLNQLTSEDLYLFIDWKQAGTKNIYFENHPIVDNPTNNNMLQDSQLLTKANIEEFESYLSNKKLIQYACLPAFNWENEWSKLNKDNVDESIQDTISGKPETSNYVDFKSFLSDDKYEAKATYKFLYTNSKPNERNPERVTNIIPLNNLVAEGSVISGVVHFSVAGFVSVKTDLPNQESGTIYLEARRANKNTIGTDNQWQTIDSAVFKFHNSNDTKKSPGTFVTLTGYLTTEFETRLKLNLKSQGYSMNIFEYRDETLSPVTHYVNTFVGFVHVPNIKSTPPNSLYFSNINYQPYLKDNIGLVNVSKNLSNGELGTNTTPVRDVINLFCNAHPSKANDIRTLNIDANEMMGVKNTQKFEINGLRLSPTGKIYFKNESIPVHPGMTVYPSYTSGVVYAKKPYTISIIEKNYPAVYQFNKGYYVLNDISFTQLSVLKDIQWPKETPIYSRVTSESFLKYDNYKEWQTGGTYITSATDPGSIPIPGTFSISSYATDKPRRQYHQEAYRIDFSTELQGLDLVGDITCTFTAWPSTWGSGHGNESYGRIYAGDGTTLCNPHYFSTKNMSAWMTWGLCTGSRWSCPASVITGKIIQPNSYKSIIIKASADTAKDDGSKKTCFGVFLSNLMVSYNYNHDIEKSNIVEHHSGGIYYYYGQSTAKLENQIANNCVYPSNISSTSITNPGSIPPPYSHFDPLPKFINDSTIFNDISATINYKDADLNPTWTELSVYPVPQNYIF